MNKDLSRLSMAEELWLWRLRQPSPSNAPGGMTMSEAAKFLGMSLQRYKNLEAGRRINIAVDELPSLNFLRVPRPEMSLREQCILARRRSGLFIRQIAQEYGLSHTRVLTHEDMASRRLIDYWSQKGFTGWLMPPEMVVAPVAPPIPAAQRPRGRPIVLSVEERAQNYNEAREAIDTVTREAAATPARPTLIRRAPPAPEPEGPRLIERQGTPAQRPQLRRNGVVVPPPPARPQLKPRGARHAA